MTAWTRSALARLGEIPGVWRVGLALIEGGGRQLRFTASDRALAEGIEWCRVDAYDDVPLNTAIRTGTSVLGALEDIEDAYPDFVARQSGTATVAVAAVPIVAAGQPLGGYVMFFDHPQAFDRKKRLELANVGADLGSALRRIQRRGYSPDVAHVEEPQPPGTAVALHNVPPDPTAVAQARRFLRTTLQDWGIDEDTTEAAVLCLSELVTNAVIHSHGGCVVRVLLEGGALTTTVRGSSTPDGAAVEVPYDPLPVHGRGLQLVEALAARWGHQLEPVGSTAWFVLEPQ